MGYGLAFVGAVVMMALCYEAFIAAPREAKKLRKDLREARKQPPAGSEAISQAQAAAMKEVANRIRQFLVDNLEAETDLKEALGLKDVDLKTIPEDAILEQFFSILKIALSDMKGFVTILKEIRTIEEENARLTKTLDDRRKELDEAGTKSANLEAELSTAQGRVEAAGRGYAQVLALNGDLERENRGLRALVESLEAEVRSLREAGDAQREALAARRVEVDRLRGENDHMYHQLCEAERMMEDMGAYVQRLLSLMAHPDMGLLTRPLPRESSPSRRVSASLGEGEGPSDFPWLPAIQEFRSEVVDAAQVFRDQAGYHLFLARMRALHALMEQQASLLREILDAKASPVIIAEVHGEEVPPDAPPDSGRTTLDEFEHLLLDRLAQEGAPEESPP